MPTHSKLWLRVLISPLRCAMTDIFTLLVVNCANGHRSITNLLKWKALVICGLFKSVPRTITCCCCQKTRPFTAGATIPWVSWAMKGKSIVIIHYRSLFTSNSEGDLIPRPVNSSYFGAQGVTVLQVSAGGNHSLALAKVPLELSNNVSQSQGSPSLSSSTSQISTPVSVSKSAPSSPATPQSRIRSQQLVLAMLESSTEATQSKGRDRSYTVEASSPRSADTDLESSGTKKDKDKREKKRSRSKLEDSGSRTSRVSSVVVANLFS